MRNLWWLGAVVFSVACSTATSDATDDTDVDTDETDVVDTDPVARIDALTPDLTNGEAIYSESASCTLCHLSEGEGSGAFPNIQGKSKIEIIEAMLEGPGVMASAEELGLSDQEVADVAAYAESL